jgi:hypothetical protein
MQTSDTHRISVGKRKILPVTGAMSEYSFLVVSITLNLLCFPSSWAEVHVSSST